MCVDARVWNRILNCSCSSAAGGVTTASSSSLSSDSCFLSSYLRRGKTLMVYYWGVCGCAVVVAIGVVLPPFVVGRKTVIVILRKCVVRSDMKELFYSCLLLRVWCRFAYSIVVVLQQVV